MKLDKAIEILTEQVQPKPIYRAEGLIGAIKLGIEALKQVKECRLPLSENACDPLLGETED